jgi:hypothetical protein
MSEDPPYLNLRKDFPVFGLAAQWLPRTVALSGNDPFYIAYQAHGYMAVSLLKAANHTVLNKAVTFGHHSDRPSCRITKQGGVILRQRILPEP